MTEFKVGDRVRNVKSLWPGEVVGLRPLGHEFPYFVEWDDDGGHDWYRTDALELVTPDPTVYKLQVPPEPPEHLTRVRPVSYPGVTWTRDGSLWVRENGEHLERSWSELLAMYPTGLEPVPAEPESEYDVAKRYFEERPEALETALAQHEDASRHAAVIVRKVLADEPTARHLDALHLISGDKCTNFTGGYRCWQMGKTRGARYSADAWCDACIAQDALDSVSADEPASAGPDIGTVLRELARLRNIGDALAQAVDNEFHGYGPDDLQVALTAWKGNRRADEAARDA